MNPPAEIDGADVIEWAWSDLPFGEVPSSDGTQGVMIHGLAICRYPNSSEIYRFSCNAKWVTEQDSDYESIETAKAELPEQYRRLPVVWQKY